MAENKENETVDILDAASEDARPAQPETVEPASRETEAATEAPQEAPAPAGEGAEVRKAVFADLVPSGGGGARHNLDLLMDVTVPMTVELGHTRMKIEEVLKLSPGTVIELDTHADEPIDLKVNGKLIARGEIVVVDDFFGIRICEIVTALEE
jgi:flagellar motor switch protein FliN/FliY